MTMGSALWPTQQGTHTLLAAFSGLTAIAQVLDFVPPNTAYDYVTHGPATEQKSDTEGLRNREVRFAIDGYSRAQGWSSVKQMAHQVILCLQDSKPTITGWTVLKVEFESTTTYFDQDGVGRRASVIFRAFLGGS